MDIRTAVMDVGASSTATTSAPTPNRVLLELRTSRGWGRPRLAKELHRFCLSKSWPSPGEENIKKQIYRLESGQIRSPDEFYSRLYCQFFEKSPHDLFGSLRVGGGASTFKLYSHKFIPIYVGVQAAENLRTAVRASPAGRQWTECYSTPVTDRDTGTCTMYVWPFGVVVYHLIEDLTPSSVAEISAWRRVSYPENIDWATRHLEERIEAPVHEEPYVLSTYWVESAPWNGARLDSALRLLCIPRVLLEREDDHQGPSQAHAELVEQSLLREGFDHPEIMEFGMKGISFGFASWSGVVYHPTASARALTEHELISCELSVQAAWSYCNSIRSAVERGRDPVVPAEYGWRFVRGLRSRLTTERPQETSQHRSMREAIVETSGLSRHLAHAVETLREAADGGQG
ncbi:hypothetical protein FDG2_0110 [Candidatus Protofrankia californiensis]|uniref:Uncharacterized protein n=1 Tax=Candidatus Protofrankia californiensis TaxID=1839754 RepID=A0A1C3NSW5_9ACTN|nr:hypothetical protein FDG2_0110 [Candidatus Protofrankia californiensis]